MKNIQLRQTSQQLADYFGVSVGYLVGVQYNPKRYDDEIVMEPEERLTVVHSRERYDKENKKECLKISLHFSVITLSLSAMMNFVSIFYGAGCQSQ